MGLIRSLARYNATVLCVPVGVVGVVFIADAQSTQLDPNYQLRFVAGRCEVGCSANHREKRHRRPVGSGSGDELIVPVREVTIEVGLD